MIDVFRVMLAYRPIWSCNEREATLIAQRLAALDSGDSCDCKVSRDMLQEIESANVNEETVAWLCDRLLISCNRSRGRGWCVVGDSR